MAKSYPLELRAEAVAAVVAGEQPSDVAKRLGVDKSRISRWCSADIPAVQALDRNETQQSQRVAPVGGVVRALRRRTIAELAHELVCVSLETLTVQARVAGREPWVERQSARGLAEYRGVELDRLIRLLPAFQPDDEPEPEGDAIDASVVPAGLGDGERDNRPADRGP